MSKWYVKSNTVEKIVSIPNSTPLDAAIAVFKDTNNFDIIDDYFFVDERGMRTMETRDSQTQVIKTERVMRKAQ